MLKRSTAFVSVTGTFALFAGLAVSQQAVPLAKRIAHYDPAEQPPRVGVHRGAGSMAFAPNLVDPKYVQGNWGFYQSGILNPHSSIGEHFHLTTEEMFVILDGDAEFTIDGRTSVVKGPAAVPVRLGHAHGVYNPTDKPMHWMDMSVAIKKGAGGGFDLGDQRVGAMLDPVPQFINGRFDRTLLQPMAQMNGVMYRRVFQPEVFSTPWAFVDHIVVNAGGTFKPAMQPDISEIYYVIAGAGSVTVNNETAPIRGGDGIPVDMAQTQSFTQAGPEPLEMYVVAVARDLAAKDAIPRNQPRPPAAR